ncbi:hypothetical protein POM88_017135 [Heracleum sosnowskyi]|uniref:Peptidase A1 domain-containing protein n=1 Tax=Heracleum sosnowskyi TaxID=360622 RepID=A0AAD8INB1_9APIA|nr:hypothetical protein POM88_017135 [Heracleum sosnowskyi]
MPSVSFLVALDTGSDLLWVPCDSLLLRFIAPENLPVEYGGLERENSESSHGNGKVVHHKVRPGTVERFLIPVPQAGVTVFWDLTVVGFEVEHLQSSMHSGVRYRNSWERLTTIARNQVFLQFLFSSVLSIAQQVAMASCTLEAGVKIYSMRVDSVHSEAYTR